MKTHQNLIDILHFVHLPPTDETERGAGRGNNLKREGKRGGRRGKGGEGQKEG